MELMATQHPLPGNLPLVERSRGSANPDGTPPSVLIDYRTSHTKKGSFSGLKGIDWIGKGVYIIRGC